MFVRFHLTLWLCLALLGLAGCGHTPMTRTVFEATGLGHNVDAVKLNPDLRYLRVSTPDRVVLMVLGYTDAMPQGPLETWYSAEGEVLQLQNGRAVSTVGLQTDWRRVDYTGLPSWMETLSRGWAQYVRTRDEMPGYRFGIQEALQIYKVAAPANSRLQGIPAWTLQWYEEAPNTSQQGAQQALPSARYALVYHPSGPRVVYGEQCFALGRCISWQTWPATF